MANLSLRPYQSDAVRALQQALQAGQHPVCALPTGSGKSLVAAALAAAWQGRVLVVTHRKELIEQNANQLLRLGGTDTGIYSAGIGRRDTGSRVLFAGIQSIYQRMHALQQAGPFGLVLVDECHRVQPRADTQSMYSQVFSGCSSALRVGLSATPYRLNDGPIWGDGMWFSCLASQATIRALTPQYLAPLRGILGARDIDTSQVHTRQGEYLQGELAQVASDEGLIDAALTEICALGRDRRSWLLFGVNVAHAELLAKALTTRGIVTGLVTGKTPDEERDRILASFKAQELRAVVNCEVLTTGFDAPTIDLIAMLRPTLSKALTVQMLGRGCRQAQGKADCLILDYAGNLMRHRPLDGIPPLEESEARQEQRKRTAPGKPRQVRHDSQAADVDPMDDPEPIEVRVDYVAYKLEPSRKYQGKTNLVVLYKVDGRPPAPAWVRKYITLEYPGRGSWYAEQWFMRRHMAMPASAASAKVFLEQQRRRVMPHALVIRPAGQYWEVLMERFKEEGIR